MLHLIDTEKFNLKMDLYIDDDAEEINVHITFWNKRIGVVSGFEYPAAEYRSALAKFRELEKVINGGNYENKTEK